MCQLYNLQSWVKYGLSEKKNDEHRCIRNTYAHQLLAIRLLLKQPILLYQKLVPWSRLSMQLDQNMGDGGTVVAWDL